MQCYTLKSEKYVNPASECFYHFTYSETENTVLHTHEFYEIFVVVSGEIIHLVNEKNNDLLRAA